MVKKPLRPFLEFCNKEPKSKDFQGTYNQDEYDRKDKSDAFFVDANQALQVGRTKGIVVRSSKGQDRRLVGRGRDAFDSSVLLVEVAGSGGQKLELADLAIHMLVLQTASAGLIRINRCSIVRLQTHSGQDAGLEIVDSNIGTLAVQFTSVKHLEMMGGSILNIDCPPPGTPNPFTGTVSLKNVFLPRDRNKYLLRGAQPYRNMRHHLRNLENSQIANLFHAAELAVERADDTRANRLISLLYGCFSDYGSSALRPVIWLLGTYAAVAALIFWRDAAAVVSTMLSGYQEAFVSSDTYGRLARSAYLALQGIVNPLQIFGTRGVVIPRDWWTVGLLSVQGIFSITWIALAIFAIRRRFKMQ